MYNFTESEIESFFIDNFKQLVESGGRWFQGGDG